MDIIDEHRDHQSVAFLNGESWNKTEEYYYWKNNGGKFFEGNNNLLMVRETGNNDYDEARPISWFKDYEGGRSFYTAMGHNHSDYSDDNNFIKHVEEGIKWAGDFEGSTDTPVIVTTPVVQLIDNGTYFLTSPFTEQNLTTSEAIDNNAEMTDADADSDEQRWTFTHLDDNIYTIRNIATNRFLEVPQANCSNGANVGTWTSSNSSHQQWEVFPEQYLFHKKPEKKNL